MSANTVKILVFERGNIELAFPAEWIVKPDPAGHITLRDPNDDCVLEVSYLRLPPLRPEAPGLTERLEHAFGGVAGERSRTPVTVVRRGDTEIAWMEYAYDAEDTKGGPAREARGRWLLASNGVYQVLMTFYYWPEDAGWAVPAIERIADSLQLLKGVGLSSPSQHWALRDPS